jgi:hypothetical protein
MTDPIARPGDRDEGIEHATEQVVDTWEQSADGKDPNATSEDFASMREGMARVASREQQLGQAEGGDAGDATARQAENRATGQSGPDA